MTQTVLCSGWPSFLTLLAHIIMINTHSPFWTSMREKEETENLGSSTNLPADSNTIGAIYLSHSDLDYVRLELPLQFVDWFPQ